MPAPLPVFVVHSPRLTERRADLEAALADLDWSATWIEHPDGGELGAIDWLRLRPHVRLARAEVSVYLKQRDVMRAVAAGQADRVLVLEDDALLPANASTVLGDYLAAAPADYGMLFFGASYDLEAEPLPDHRRFGTGPRTRSMSGYVITRAAARDIASRLDRARIAWPIDITIDEYIRSGVIKAYWSVPPLIGNGSVTGRYPTSLAGREWRTRPLPSRLIRWWRKLAR